MNENQLLSPQELKSRQYLTTIENTEITNEADNLKACELLKEVSTFAKAVKSQEKDAIQPLKEQVDQIKDFYKKPLEFLKNADSLLREKINNYAQEKIKRERDNALELKRLQEEEALKSIESLEQLKKDADKYDEVTKIATVNAVLEKQQELIEASAKVQKVNIANDSVSFREIFTFDVVDLSKVPVEYIQINSKAVNEAIKSGVRFIDGLNIYQTIRAAVK